MSDAQIFEVHRLAQQANSKAESALHDAAAAKSDILHHEKICAERYTNINGQLVDIKNAASKAADGQKESNGRIYDTLHRLEVAIATQATSAVTKVSTSDLMLRWGGLIAGIVGGCYGIMK